MSEKSIFKFDFSKDEDKKSFKNLPQQEKQKISDEGQDEAIEIQKKINSGEASNSHEAEVLMRKEKYESDNLLWTVDLFQKDSDELKLLKEMDPKLADLILSFKEFEKNFFQILQTYASLENEFTNEQNIKIETLAGNINNLFLKNSQMISEFNNETNKYYTEITSTTSGVARLYTWNNSEGDVELIKQIMRKCNFTEEQFKLFVQLYKFKEKISGFSDKEIKSFLTFFESGKEELKLSEENRRELFYSIVIRTDTNRGKLGLGGDEYKEQLSQRLEAAYKKDILSERLTPEQELQNEKKAMENIMSKDNFAEDEDLYFHHSHPETLYNVLGKGLMSHGFHDRLHNARSTGSGGGWDRTSKNESKFICFWSPHGYYKHLIDLIKNPRKYINKKVRDDDFVEQFGDFRQLHKSPKEIMNLSDEQKDKLIKEVLSKKENNKTEDKQSILKTFIMPSAFSNGYTAIIKTEEVPYRYMHYDVSSGAEMHFKHRIKPQQIVGIVIKENHGNEEERLNLEFFKKCCKLFSKPIYDENFNLLWPKKMTKEDVSEFVKKRNEDLKVKDGK